MVRLQPPPRRDSRRTAHLAFEALRRKDLQLKRPCRQHRRHRPQREDASPSSSRISRMRTSSIVSPGSSRPPGSVHSPSMAAEGALDQQHLDPCGSGPHWQHQASCARVSNLRAAAASTYASAEENDRCAAATPSFCRHEVHGASSSRSSTISIFAPRYNITPTQPIVTILEREGRRTAELFRWGFVPGWVKDPREFPLLINARAETMADKPAFRDCRSATRAASSRPAAITSGGQAPRRQAQPYYITTADERADGLCRALFDLGRPQWRRGRYRRIVTVDPNPEISGIYDRMPAILARRDDRRLAQHPRRQRAEEAVAAGPAAAAGHDEIPSGRPGHRQCRRRGPRADHGDRSAMPIDDSSPPSPRKRPQQRPARSVLEDSP